MLTEEDAKEAARWKEYREELTTDFPQAPPVEVPPEVPAEEPGHGVNRRVFFVWPETLGRAVVVKSLSDYSDALLLEPPGKPKDDEEPGIAVIHTVTPEQINSSRQIRWYLTGDLNAEVRSYPQFPGREGNYLRALLARITAGTAVSPKGYYKAKKPSDEDDEEEEEEEEEDVEEEEEEEASKEDMVFPVKKFRPENIRDLANPQVDLWVHHAAHILRQGRTVWINMDKPKDRKKSDEEEDEEDEEEVDEEEEEEQPAASNKEVGPKLFSDLEQDSSLDGTKPWSARTSSSVFTEFEVVNVRSNLWPGANALCTAKGKVENIYLGDGLKFQGHSYAPFLPEEPQAEYKDGPELTEIVDPSVQEEQEWLAKLQLEEIADVEEKFVDNEEGEEEEEEDEDEDEDDD
jgi:radial spoke head protein 4A